MRIDTYSCGRRTNKTVRAPRGRAFAHDASDLPMMNPHGISTVAGRAPIPEHLADKYLAWMNTLELPDNGSTTAQRSLRKTAKNIQRGLKKQKKVAGLRLATEDMDLRDSLPRKVA